MKTDGVFVLKQEVNLEPSATSHSLSDLRASTEHTIRLQAVTDDKRSEKISTVFTTGRFTRTHIVDVCCHRLNILCV